MKKLFILASACLLISACNSNKKSSAKPEAATEVADMHNAENSLDYEGTYTGTFPAADCPGINITLTLKRDKTFELTSDYIDRKDATFKDTGNYTIDGNLITLFNGDEKKYYKVGENTLTALDYDKKEITGDLANFYILHKQ
ncbi:copper resistance protein NlpE [Phocaeicola sp.]